MNALLKNVYVIDNQSSYHQKIIDIWLVDGMIKALGNNLRTPKATQVMDVAGLSVTPGWFDLNAHFNDPGYEHKEDIFSGSKSALYGGFTDVLLSPATNPILETKSDVSYILNHPNQSVSLHVTAALSKHLKDESLTDIMDLKQAGALAFSNGDLPITNTELLLNALKYTAHMGVKVFQNPYDIYLAGDTHIHEGVFSTTLGLHGEPPLSEEIMISRDLSILKYTGGAIHFSNLSSADSVNLIRNAKKNGLKVTCDVAIHHLLFNDQDINEFDVNFKVKPPFRSEKDREALIKGVIDGSVDAISSLHRPHEKESKMCEFCLAESGTIALQTFYPALLKVSNVIPMEILVERITHGPRNILNMNTIGLYPGSKAKLTLLDPKKQWKFDNHTNQSKSENSPFWNQKLKGQVMGTINGTSMSYPL